VKFCAVDNVLNVQRQWLTRSQEGNDVCVCHPNQTSRKHQSSASLILPNSDNGVEREVETHNSVRAVCSRSVVPFNPNVARLIGNAATGRGHAGIVCGDGVSAARVLLRPVVTTAQAPHAEDIDSPGQGHRVELRGRTAGIVSLGRNERLRVSVEAKQQSRSERQSRNRKLPTQLLHFEDSWSWQELCQNGKRVDNEEQMCSSVPRPSCPRALTDLRIDRVSTPGSMWSFTGGHVPPALEKISFRTPLHLGMSGAFPG